MQSFKFSFKFASKLFLKVFFLVGIFSIGYFIGFKGYLMEFDKYPKVKITREVPPEYEDLDFSLFWKVWDTIHSQYFDEEKIIDANLLYGAISGMVSGLNDPYSVFLEPKENRVVQEDLRGNFEGVGIQIGFSGKQLAVIAPLAGSPAEKAGVKAGDLILGIRDKKKGIDMTTVNITLPEAVQVIRGDAGTEVTLILFRESNGTEPFEVNIIREEIDVPSIVYEVKGDSESIGYIRVIKFVDETKEEWDDAVRQILKNPSIDSIILDLRNNPGGFLDRAVDLASEFLEVGDVVVIQEEGGKKTEIKSQNIGKLRGMDLVVLVNGGSASASEILAGALGDNGVATILGEETFGKGTIQEAMPVDGGAGLHLTIARWLTPNGTWVNENKIKPDVEISDNPETQEDEQLQKAIELLKN